MFFYDPAYPWLKNGLVGHWCPSLTGPTGTDLLDLSGQNNKGSLTNMDAATDWVNSGGKLALDFDGVNDYIALSNQDALAFQDRSPFSVSFWFRAGFLGNFRRVIARSAQSGVLNEGWWIGVGAGVDRLQFRRGVSGSSAYLSGVGSISYSDFIHVVGTYNGNSIALYQNGAFLGSLASTQSIITQNTTTRIGTDEQASISGLYLGGQLDDLRVYNRVLTPQEIQDLYIGGRGFGVSRRPTSLPYKRKWWNLTKNPLYRPAQPINRGTKLGPVFYDPDTSWTKKGLVGHWCPSATSATGTQLLDLSGNNNNGTLTNMDAATDWVDSGGKLALDFDGVNDNVAINSQMTVWGSSFSSVSAWVYSRYISGDDFVYHEGNPLPMYLLRITGGKAEFGRNNNGAWSFSTAPSNLGLNKWVHLYGEYNSSTGTSLYVDGVKVANNASAFGGTATISSQVIGARNGATDAFDGQIDDIRIYNRVLTPEEIQKLYIGGRGYGVSRKPNSKWWSIDSNYKPTTKKKRGSLINLNIPGRTWISEPEGKSFISKGERLSTGGLAYDNKDLKSLYPYNTGKKVGPIYYNPKMPWVSNGLVGHWCPSLTGPTGTDLFDLSGQNNKGALTNMDAATDWVDSGGKLALDFDGVNDYTSMPINAAYQLSSFSWSWWQKRTGNVTQSYPGVLAHTNVLSASSKIPGFCALLAPSTDPTSSNKCFVQISDNTTTIGAAELIAGNDNVWHSYVGSVDRNSGKISLFKDGVFQSEASGIPSGIVVNRSMEICRRTTDTIGLNFVYSTTQLDDIRVYNRALTPQEIQDLYIGGRGFGASNKPYKKLNSVPPAKKKLNKSRIDRKRPVSLVFPDHNNEWVTNGLVGHWCPSLTGPTGTQLLDLSGQNNAGTLTNMDAATDWVDSGGKLALDFDGVNDYVATNLSCSNRSNLDISAWIYRASTSNNAYVGAGEGGGAGPRANIYIAGSTTYVTAETSGSNAYGGVSNTRIGWNHFHYSYVYIGSNSDNLKLWINGVEQSLTYFGFTPGTLGNVGFFEIGRTKGEGLYATAQIDDVRAWSRRLTPQEIQKLYIGGRGFGFSRKPNRSPALFSENIYTQTNRSLVFPG